MDLPQPSSELQAHSHRLRARIISEIERVGPMRLDRYLQLCLYQPGLGYYSAGLQKFGRSGDFVTAPELGPIFAQTLARPIAALFRAIKYPSIVELGAGTGALAAQLCLTLEKLKALPERYDIVETSADLRERQMHTLSLRAPGALPRVRWLNEPPSQRFDGVLIANEVVDALPCVRFKRTQQQLLEQVVDISENGVLRLDWQPASGDVSALVERIHQQHGQEWPEHYQSECVPMLRPWLKAVSQNLREGAFLCFDYGYQRAEYYLPQRSMGTLVGHYRQRAVDDVLLHPGLVDWSTWVDFTALAEAAQEAKLEVAGYCNQAHFLMHAGLSEVYSEPQFLSEREHMLRNEEIRKLTLPGEMGERFKLMSMTRGLQIDELPPALASPQLLGRL